MKIIFILLLCLSITFAQNINSQSEYITINNALKTFTEIVIQYDEKLDQSAKFPELQAAIDAISASMQNYKGKAQDRLPLIKKLNTDVRVNYASCVGPVYEWCVAMNSTLDIFIKYIDDGMAVRDRSLAWNLAGRLLRQGLNKTTLSLDLLEDIQKKMGYLETELKDLLTDIDYDFSPDGEYGKIRKELMTNSSRLANDIRTEAHHQAAAKEAEAAAKKRAVKSLIFSIFTVIISIVAGPIGAALRLPALFIENKLGHHVNTNNHFDYGRSDSLIQEYQNQRHDIEEQLKSIQLMFNALKEKTNEAVKIAGEVSAALEQEATHLRNLKGLIQSAETNGVALLSQNEDLRRALIPTFRNLGGSCYQYTVRHGYSLQASRSASRRSRRQALDKCQDNKQKYVKMLCNAMPSNATADENEKRNIARSIVQHMECETINLLTADNPVKFGEFADERSSSSFVSSIKNIVKRSSGLIM